MKTKINFIISTFLILISILLLYACSSNELKNKEATDLVRKIPNEIIRGTIKIPSFFESDPFFNPNYLDEYNNENAHLFRRDILTNTQIHRRHIEGGTGPGYDKVRITSDFTDSARVLILGGGGGPYIDKEYIVKCGELKFVEVVGVFQEEGSKTAEIEYKVTFIPTMFADVATFQPRYEKGATYSKKLTAKKYDNGWRIEN